MKSGIGEIVVTIVTAIIAVAMLSVIVSRRSNTTGVLTAAGNSFATALSAATSPVTGVSPNGASAGLGFGNTGLNFGIGLNG